MASHLLKLLSAVCVGVATEWIPGGTGAILPVGSARWYHPASGGDRRSDVRLHVLCAALRWPALPHSRGTAAERHRRGKAVWADCVGGGTLSWVGRRSAWSETAQVRLQGPTEVSFLDFYVCFIIRSVSLWLWSRLHIYYHTSLHWSELWCSAVCVSIRAHRYAKHKMQPVYILLTALWRLEFPM